MRWRCHPKLNEHAIFLNRIYEHFLGIGHIKFVHPHGVIELVKCAQGRFINPGNRVCPVLINKAVTYYYYKFYTKSPNQCRNLVWNSPDRTIKCSSICIASWPTWQLSQSYSCIFAPLMAYCPWVIFGVQVCPRHHTGGWLSWVEVNPFLPLRAGTQTIGQTPHSAPTCSEKAHLQEAHPPHIYHQDRVRQQSAPGPLHQRKSHLSICLHHFTQPTEELVPLPQRHNQASLQET